MRLALLYVGLFLASGLALLTITVTVWQSTARVVAPANGAAAQTPSTSSPGGLGVPGNPHGGPGEQRRSDLAQLLIASGIALAIMTALSVVLGWLVAGRLLRPLHMMTARTRRISATNLHERLNVDGPEDELKELGDTFDDLLGRLERSFQLERQFVANASHELRTPLSTMRASLDVAMAKPGPLPQQVIVLADRLRQELDHVDGLLESFLTLAHAQSGELDDQSVMSLDDLVSVAVEGCSAAISQMELTVQREECPGASVRGSKALLSRMVENVMNNAVKHNMPRGWIRVRTTVEGRLCRLIAENGGPVLAQGNVDELAKPFRRIGADRTGADRGIGLGLTIVKSIAEIHGGTLQLQARREGGIRAIIALPLAVPVAAEATQ